MPVANEYQDDEEVKRAGAHAASQGLYTRPDFLTVMRWKSARSLPLAAGNSAADIAQATCAALDPVDEPSRMRWLTSLRGVAVPVGSALVHFALPDRYPILDHRALTSLGYPKRRTQYSIEFWLAYVDRCQELARDAGVSVPELDKALWQDSRETRVRSAALLTVPLETWLGSSAPTRPRALGGPTCHAAIGRARGDQRREHASPQRSSTVAPTPSVSRAAGLEAARGRPLRRVQAFARRAPTR